MKKTKEPSAKTLARKAKEAAMIAWGKGMRARFKADLREMFVRERREKQESEEAKRKQAEEAPRLAAMASFFDLAAREKAAEQKEKAVSEAARKYIDSLDTPRGKLGHTPAAPKMAPDKNSLYRKVDTLLQQKKQGPTLMDTTPKPAGETRQYLTYDPSGYGNAEEAAQFTRALIPVVDARKATKEEMDYLNRALVAYLNNAKIYGYTATMPQQLSFDDEKAKSLEAKYPSMKYQAIFIPNIKQNKSFTINGNEVPYLGIMQIVPGFSLKTLERDSQQAKARGEASTSSQYHRFNHEMGHNEHRTTYPDSFLHPDKKIMDGADESYIYNHVSHYPRTYWGKDYTMYIQEVFAEIWAMVINGDTLEPGVQQIFNRIKENRPK